jgi:hypothetical protein
MNKSKTVIVVGAGASREIDLPTGAELKVILKRLFDVRFEDGIRLKSGDHRLFESIRVLSQKNGLDVNQYLYACWRIRDCIDLAPSIDNYIDAQRNDELAGHIGKLGIYYALSKCERESKLFKATNEKNDKIEFSSLENTWLVSLFRILIEANTIESFIESLRNIVFVSFNYDRAIEFFIRHAVAQYYHLSFDEAIKVLDVLRIHYPYGNLGPLTNQPSRRSGLGNETYGQDLIASSGRLRTFTEQVKSSLIQAMHDDTADAEIVVFLGFAFHPQNLRLLFDGAPWQVRRILGTGKGLSDTDISIICDELNQYCRQVEKIEIVNATCSELFYNYKRFLSY